MANSHRSTTCSSIETAVILPTTASSTTTSAPLPAVFHIVRPCSRLSSLSSISSAVEPILSYSPLLYSQPSWPFRRRGNLKHQQQQKVAPSSLGRLAFLQVSAIMVWLGVFLTLLQTVDGAVVVTAPPRVPLTFTSRKDPPSSFQALVPPPVDFSALGQMAVLGDFDGLTPVVTPGQENTFDSHTFSILEMVKVPVPSANSAPAAQDHVLSVPVVLASFALDPALGSGSNFGISATCVLDHAPHQVYVGGYFRQLVSTSVGFSARNETTTTSTNAPTSNARTGLNFIGLYDAKLKRFLAMDQGLDGPVHDLLCDSAEDKVFVVGQFRAPLPAPDVVDDYTNLGSFGGGVAVWKRGQEVAIDGKEGQDRRGFHPLSQASGSWQALPFKGVNGVVSAVAKAQDGTYYFGGSFDTTTDGESFSAPDTQPVNMDTAMVMTGNGLDATQDRNIICESSTPTKSNWIMQDNMPGYWRVKFPLYITPTLFRLWNIDAAAGLEAAGRGTKTFSIMAQPSNQFLNLSYIDLETNTLQHCTICSLLPQSSASSLHPYQDFVVVNPQLLQSIQIDVVSWYGAGGGLGGLEVYQSEIFVRAVDEINFPSLCATNLGEAARIMSGARDGDNNDMTAYSSFMGADWVSAKMPQGWQTVLAATVPPEDSNVRGQAYVDMAPYLQETGIYDVYLYTPACNSGALSMNNDTATAGAAPSNACANRGWVDVSMYFGSPQNVMTTTLDQRNTVDKAEKIYSGMIVHSTHDFRPHVVVGPSVSTTGTSGGGSTQHTVIVDSIQFVKQASLNSTNSLLFYRPGSATSSKGSETSASRVQGMDASTWGVLPTQLPEGSIVNSLHANTASPSTSLIVAGQFQGVGYSNIVEWNGASFAPLGQGSSSGSSSGLDGAVLSSVSDGGSTLYMVGTFQQAYTSAGAGMTALPGGVASYSTQTKTWSSVGNITEAFLPGAQFRTIEISMGVNGEKQLVLSGNFTWAQQGTGGQQGAGPAMTVAVWDLGLQQWIRDDLSSSSSGQQQLQDPSGFKFGFLRGQISYLNRVLGSSNNGSTTGSSPSPVVLVAGMIDSLDTYKVQQPENVAWLTASGKLKTMNLAPGLSMSLDGSHVPVRSNPASLPQTSAGLMYFNKTSQAWITIAAGAQKDGTIGAGYFYTPPVPSATQDTELSYRSMPLGFVSGSAGAVPTMATGEILALGVNKDDSNGHAIEEEGKDLLLIGGRFRAPGYVGATHGVNAIAIYDLTEDRTVPMNLMPALHGANGRDPAIHVIKNRPGKGSLVLAGDFSSLGSDVNCEVLCVWDPAHARHALNRKRSLETSFKSIYGDNNKKHMGSIRGIVHDIAFEDDKNMFVAGDLVVEGVACGVASFNFDHGKWTTFGSLINTTAGTSLAHPPGPDTLMGPVSAIAHDSTFHLFFIAGRSVLDGSAYFKKWNGIRFVCVSTEFMPTSEIHRIEILPAAKNAPTRKPFTPTPTSTTTDGSTNNDLTNPNENNNSSNNNSSMADTASSGRTHPEDSTEILEQGYILLVAGRIVLGTPSSSALSVNNDHQESSLAFFDGQSWYPFLQSSRNISMPDPATLIHPPTAPISPIIQKRKESIAASGKSSGNAPQKRADQMAMMAGYTSFRLRDQGVFRALAIAHLPRIIAREYLGLPYIILISIAIALALIFLIVLAGYFVVWLKRRLAKEQEASRPRPGSSFMEDGDAYGPRPLGGYAFYGAGGGAAAAAALSASGSQSKSSLFKKSKASDMGPKSTSALMESLGITSALESSRQFRSQPSQMNSSQTQMSQNQKSATIGAYAGEKNSRAAALTHRTGAGGTGASTGAAGSQVNLTGQPYVYRPNSTIAEATGALVTEFVRNHQQQRGTGSTVSLAQQQLQHQQQHQQQQQQQQQQQRQASLEQEVFDPNAPPSPDRTSKRSRQSAVPLQQQVATSSSASQAQGRDSSSSDLMNPASQSRFASLLAAGALTPAGKHHPHDPSTPGSNPPTSPATTMTLSMSTPTPIPGGLSGDGGASGASGAGGVIYYAKYPFRAREIGELGFKTGDRILVVDMSDDIWWMGVIQDATGQQLHGVFPSNYVGPTP